LRGHQQLNGPSFCFVTGAFLSYFVFIGVPKIKKAIISNDYAASKYAFSKP